MVSKVKFHLYVPKPGPGICAECGQSVYASVHSRSAQVGKLPNVSQPTKGIPDCTDLLEVITVLAQAPRDRFRRLELYDAPYRDAAERLREFAVALAVGGASDTWDQLGKVCAATLQRLEK